MRALVFTVHSLPTPCGQVRTVMSTRNWNGVMMVSIDPSNDAEREYRENIARRHERLRVIAEDAAHLDAGDVMTLRALADSVDTDDGK